MKLIPKYQQGFGIVPVGYTPLPWTVTATSGVATTTPDASTDDKTKKDKLFSDTIINSLKSNALTSDMEFFLEHSSAFSNQILSGMVSAGSIEQQTKELLLYATRMQNENKAFLDAKTAINTKNAENEIAISAEGYVFTYSNGVIKPKAYTKITNKDKILTNAQLANYRANDKRFAFNSGITTTLQGATSFKEIRGIIDDAVNKLGQTGTDEENYYGTKNGGGEKFLAGLAVMGITRRELAQIPADKLIEVKLKGMDNAAQIEHAFNSVKTQLSPQQRVLLSLRAKQLGLKDADAVLLEYLHAKAKNTVSASMDIINLKDGTKGSNRTSSEADSSNKMKLTPGAQLAMELGPKEVFTLNKGTRAQVQAIATRGLLLTDQDGTGLGVKINESPLLNNLKTESMTMGGEKITREGLNRVYLKDPKVAAVNLPIDLAKLRQGIITPDFNLASKVQEVMKQVNAKGIKDPTIINKMLQQAKLPAMYIGVDSEGNHVINSTNYTRFAVLDAIADIKAFADGVDLNGNDLVRHSTDQEKEILQENMKKYDEDLEISTSFFGFGTDPVYTGSLYIPISNDILGSYIGSGEDLTIDQARKLEGLQNTPVGKRQAKDISRYTNNQQ